LGLAIGFFWFGRYGLSAKIGKTETWVRTLGLAGITEILVTLFSPFLEGVLINEFGHLDKQVTGTEVQ